MRCDAGGPTQASERNRVEHAIESYLYECYRRRTVARVSELAQSLGINRTYLSRVGPRAIGISLGDALRKRQLRFARKLLRKTALTVAEVAAHAAFGTERTFYRAFLRNGGMTPGQYRAQFRQQPNVSGRADKRPRILGAS